MSLDYLENMYIDFYLNTNVYNRKKTHEASGTSCKDENGSDVEESKLLDPKKKYLCLRLHLYTTRALCHRKPTASIAIFEPDLILLDM